MILIKLLAHNLFHKFCEEARQPVDFQGLALMGIGRAGKAAWSLRESRQGWDYTSSADARFCLIFWLEGLSPLDSSTWRLLGGLAHIVFHNLCAKADASVENPSCLKNGLGNFSLLNQGVYDGYVRLRTILSTKNVKKRAGLDDGKTICTLLKFSSGKFP